MTYEQDKGGLRVVQHDSGSWAVVHAATPELSAAAGLRQRRFAEEARDDFLATGVDFTRPAREISRDHARWADVYYKWQRRARSTSCDDTTFEYYGGRVHYGAFIPSARWAAAMRAACAHETSSHAEVSRLLNEGNRAFDAADRLAEQRERAVRALANMAHVRKTWRKREPEYARAAETEITRLAKEMTGASS